MSIEAQLLSFGKIVSAYRENKTTPVSYIEETLKRIEARRTLNAFVTVMKEEALEAAKASERRYREGCTLSPIDGVPIAVKDVINTKGTVTTNGCEAYDHFVPEKDAFVVDTLRKAGAIIVGKANTCQFAMGPIGDVCYRGPVRNPHDEACFSGGSSSGAASAVGAGIVPGAIGTDTGGSIRIPSSLCGCVGMKPTCNLVSTEGVMPLSTSIDVVGPITRTVYDNAVLLGIMARYNIEDWQSSLRPVQDYTSRIGESLRTAGLAIDYRTLEGDIDPDVRSRLLQAIHILKDLGCTEKETAFPEDFDQFRAAHQRVLVAGGHQQHIQDVANNKDMIYEQVLMRLMQGEMSSDEYIGCERRKNDLRRVLLRMLGDCDVLVVPSTPFPAGRIQDKGKLFLDGKELNGLTTYPKFTWVASFSGFPAISIPVGKTSCGLPIGLSLIARPYDEANLYRFGAALESVFNG